MKKTTGKAYHVKHPRRPKQDFVTLEEAVVERHLERMRQIGWECKVETIAFHGHLVKPLACNREWEDAVTTTIRKDRDTGEWIVRVRVNGKLDEDATYYTDDKDDAEATANMMRQHAEDRLNA